MTRSCVPRCPIRLGLYIAALSLFAFLAASCCPPALLEREPKKAQQTSASSQFEKQKTASKK